MKRGEVMDLCSLQTPRSSQHTSASPSGSPSDGVRQLREQQDLMGSLLVLLSQKTSQIS